MMDEKELEKQLKANVNEIMNEENEQVVEETIQEIEQNEFSDMTFEQIEEYLKKEEENINSLKNINNLIDENVQEEDLVDINRLNGYQVERITSLIEKVSGIIEERKEIYENAIVEFDFSEITYDELDLYNKNAEALSEFYKNTGVEYKEYEIFDIEKIKSDVEEYNNFSEKLENIEYSNLGENIDNINLLMEKHVGNKKVAGLADELYVSAEKLLDEKENELFDAQKKLNLTKEESQIYDASISDEDFVQKMMDKDIEVIEFNNKLQAITNEIEELKENLNSLKEDEPQYKMIKQLLEEKEEISIDLNKSIDSKRSQYLSRKIELNDFDKKFGNEIEEYNALRLKFNDFRTNYKIFSRQSVKKDEKQKNNDTISIDEGNEPIIDTQEENVEEKDQNTENIENEENINDNEEVNESKTDKNTKSPSNSQNKGSQTVSNQSPQQQNNESNTSEQKKEEAKDDLIEAKNNIDGFLKMSNSERAVYFKENGYLKLNEAISKIKDNDKGLKISRADRKNIIESIEKNMTKNLSKDDVKNDTTDIVSLLNKFGCDIEDFNGQELFDRLFIFDEQKNNFPAIANNLIVSANRKNLSFIIDKYREQLEKGALTQDEINKFEKYIVNPYSVSVIKKNIDNMGVIAKIKNKFDNSDNKYYNLSDRVLKDLNISKTISNINVDDKLNLNDLEYTDIEIAKNEKNISKENTKTKTNEHPVI